MFTGIITHLGKIKDIQTKTDQVYITIESDIVSKLQLGSSISIDGVCLTVTELKEDRFEIQAMPETLRLTNLSQKSIGSKINLEMPLTLAQGLDGHIVLGHVDGVGSVTKSQRESDKNWVLEVKPPAELLKFITYKGSITINGVSLTVSSQEGEVFQVSLIDYTLENTDLSDLKGDSLVNLEIDVVARYLEKLVQK
jgi:riboflavin synthase